MNVRKLVTGSLALVALAVLAASASADPAAAPMQKVTPAAPKMAAFNKSALKMSSKAAPTLSSDQQLKITNLLQRKIGELKKDRSATKFMNPEGLDFESQGVYRMLAAEYLSSSKVKKFSRYKANGGNGGTGGYTAQLIPASYSIESGDVTGATFADPCDGTVNLSFAIKNKGQKVPAGTTPKLFASLTRGGNPTVISSGFVNVAALDNNATSTAQISLRHRGSNSCAGDILIALNFIDVDQPTDYRLKLVLTNTSADATLLSGLFFNGANTEDCVFPRKLCSNNKCSPTPFCPPCPAGYPQEDGVCQGAQDPGIVIDIPSGPSTY